MIVCRNCKMEHPKWCQNTIFNPRSYERPSLAGVIQCACARSKRRARTLRDEKRETSSSRAPLTRALLNSSACYETPRVGTIHLYTPYPPPGLGSLLGKGRREASTEPANRLTSPFLWGVIDEFYPFYVSNCSPIYISEYACIFTAEMSAVSSSVNPNLWRLISGNKQCFRYTFVVERPINLRFFHDVY